MNAVKAKLYEHFVMDLTPATLQEIGNAVEHHLTVGAGGASESVRVELSNVSNEIRARVQRIIRGS